MVTLFHFKGSCNTNNVFHTPAVLVRFDLANTFKVRVKLIPCWSFLKLELPWHMQNPYVYDIHGIVGDLMCNQRRSVMASTVITFQGLVHITAQAQVTR